MRLLFKLLIISQLIYVLSLFSEEKEKIFNNANSVKWEKLDNNKDVNVIWKSYDEDKDFFKKIDSEINTNKKREGILTIENILVNKTKKNQKPIEIQPYLPLNNYLDSKTFDASVYWKSSFDGGDSGGVEIKILALGLITYK